MMKRASLLSLPVRPLLQSLQALLLQRLSHPQIRKQEAIAQEVQRTNSRLCCDWEPSFRSLYGSTRYLATRLSAHFADWRIRVRGLAKEKKVFELSMETGEHDSLGMLGICSDLKLDHDKIESYPWNSFQLSGEIGTSWKQKMQQMRRKC